jgi:hypothetical protein
VSGASEASVVIEQRGENGAKSAREMRDTVATEALQRCGKKFAPHVFGKVMSPRSPEVNT